MAWFTHYITEVGQIIGWALDRLPYHAALSITTPNAPRIYDERLFNLRTAFTAELDRPRLITHNPYHIVLDVSDICNLKCPLCVQATDPLGRRRKNMSLATALEAVDAFGNSTIRAELFNWGEPLLNKQFSKIVHSLNDRMIYTRTSSNLNLSRDFDFHPLIESGLKTIVVSIDGVTQDVYRQYRKGGEIDRVLKALRKFVELKRSTGAKFPLIEWQFLAFHHNVHEIDAAYAMATEIGVDIFRFGGARGLMADRNRMTDSDNFEQSKAHLLDSDHPLSEYGDGGERSNRWEGIGCRWLWGKIAVHADGGVSPCWTSWKKDDDLGNCTKEDIREMWLGERFREARADAIGQRDASLSPSMCSRCHASKAFVNAPDRMSRWPDDDLVTSISARIRLFLNDGSLNV